MLLELNLHCIPVDANSLQVPCWIKCLQRLHTGQCFRTAHEQMLSRANNYSKRLGNDCNKFSENKIAQLAAFATIFQAPQYERINPIFSLHEPCPCCLNSRINLSAAYWKQQVEMQNSIQLIWMLVPKTEIIKVKSLWDHGVRATETCATDIEQVFLFLLHTASKTSFIWSPKVSRYTFGETNIQRKGSEEKSMPVG